MCDDCISIINIQSCILTWLLNVNGIITLLNDLIMIVFFWFFFAMLVMLHSYTAKLKSTFSLPGTKKKSGCVLVEGSIFQKVYYGYPKVR